LNAKEYLNSDVVLEGGAKKKRESQAPAFFEPKFFGPKPRPGASFGGSMNKKVFDVDSIATHSGSHQIENATQ
jgi:hypothetical protein